MQALVVVAHPCDDSFTHAAAERAVTGLRSAGHAVDVVDLYAIGFRVAMSTAEREAYHGDTPLIDEHTREHARLVQRADCLVFVYPTWWSGQPAMLKGWLDRVMVPGVAFVFDERSGKVRPGLGHVRRLVGISSYGSPRWSVKLINDNGRRTITRTLRMSCGLRARTTWLTLYRIDASSESRRRAFLDRVEEKMAGLR
jgi:putative NADPH-quinone reductase